MSTPLGFSVSLSLSSGEDIEVTVHRSPPKSLVSELEGPQTPPLHEMLPPAVPRHRPFRLRCKPYWQKVDRRELRARFLAYTPQDVREIDHLQTLKKLSHLLF